MRNERKSDSSYNMRTSQGSVPPAIGRDAVRARIERELMEYETDTPESIAYMNSESVKYITSQDWDE